MGLAERKAIQAIKDGDYKTFEATVNQICGFTPTLEFDWASLESNPECVRVIENKKHNSYMFDRVVDMLKEVCSDDMGKTAVREGLKTIKMIPATGELNFKGGIFTVHNDFTGNGAYDTKQMKDVLEKGL